MRIGFRRWWQSSWIAEAMHIFLFPLKKKKTEATVIYILVSIQRILQVELQRSHQYQSESDGDRIDRALAGLLEKAKGSFSFSLLSCLCLCLCLCLCFFFFFLCSWWWWWWWSLCFEELDSLLNTESGAAETGCMVTSPEDCSLPKNHIDTTGLTFSNRRNSELLHQIYVIIWMCKHRTPYYTSAINNFFVQRHFWRCT